MSFIDKKELNGGGNKVESALNNYLYGPSDLSFSCRLSSFFMGLLLKSASYAFNVEEGTVKNYFSSPYTKNVLLVTLRGIAKHGVRIPHVSDTPYLVVWNFTNACNLNCKHCYQDASTKTQNELTTKEAEKILKDLADNGLPVISFSGGEPLVRKDFYHIASLAADYGMYVSIATNGTLITKDIAKKLKDINVQYVQVSIDGSNSDSHDSFRGVNGAFERALSGLKNCVEQKITTCVATTVTKQNKHEIPNILDMAVRYKADRMALYNFVPTGRGKDHLLFDLSPQEREEVLRWSYKKIHEVYSDIILSSTCPQHGRIAQQFADNGSIVPFHMYSAKLARNTKKLCEYIGGCGAGRLYASTTPDGKLLPCNFMPKVVGDLKKQKFRDIWDNSPILNELRDRSLLKGNCGSCEYNLVCGGCRSRAYAYYGDHLMPDPGCIQNKVLQSKIKV